jgi:hypothetical protein
MAMAGMNLQNMQAPQLFSPGRMGGGMFPQAGGYGGFGAGIGGTMSSGGGGGANNPRRSPRPSEQQQRHASGGAGAGNKANVPGSGSDPQEPIDINLLSDVPAWLRSLRLHKYQPIFEASNWKEMVMLDDKALEEKGVSALGARRKLLKYVLVLARFPVEVDC